MIREARRGVRLPSAVLPRRCMVCMVHMYMVHAHGAVKMVVLKTASRSAALRSEVVFHLSLDLGLVWVSQVLRVVRVCPCSPSVFIHLCIWASYEPAATFLRFFAIFAWLI
mmetsp:Transcript_78564/g.156194  ORF Transcript_78564/g.156194 Transcript_78564/m.156194 type:complete len:111 (-) Transcript_78564:161-493(-)